MADKKKETGGFEATTPTKEQQVPPGYGGFDTQADKPAADGKQEKK